MEAALTSSPRAHGVARTRWRLADVGQAVPWLAETSLSGIQRLLHRLGFRPKQALPFVRSPDPAYDTKWRAILAAFRQMLTAPEQVRLLFLDEVSYYRQPSRAPAYHRQGPTQPRAQQVPRANTRSRVIATLDGWSGQVVYWPRSQVTVSVFTGFCVAVRAAYAAVPTVCLVLDNWPVHTHPDAITALQAQHLTPLFLPTYASWLNPIEKLWRWLRQAVIHLHPHAAKLDTLRAQVRTFLDQFASGSPALLRYTGLWVD